MEGTDKENMHWGGRIAKLQRTGSFKEDLSTADSRMEAALQDDKAQRLEEEAQRLEEEEEAKYREAIKAAEEELKRFMSTYDLPDSAEEAVEHLLRKYKLSLDTLYLGMDEGILDLKKTPKEMDENPIALAIAKKHGITVEKVLSTSRQTGENLRTLGMNMERAAQKKPIEEPDSDVDSGQEFALDCPLSGGDSNPEFSPNPDDDLSYLDPTYDFSDPNPNYGSYFKRLSTDHDSLPLDPDLESEQDSGQDPKDDSGVLLAGKTERELDEWAKWYEGWKAKELQQKTKEEAKEKAAEAIEQKFAGNVLPQLTKRSHTRKASKAPLKDDPLKVLAQTLRRAARATRLGEKTGWLNPAGPKNVPGAV